MWNSSDEHAQRRAALAASAAAYRDRLRTFLGGPLPSDAAGFCAATALRHPSGFPISALAAAARAWGTAGLLVGGQRVAIQGVG